MRDLRLLKLSGESMQKSCCKLVMYSGHQMAPKGKKTLKCHYKEKMYELEFQVIEENAPAKLGRSACLKLGLIQRVFKLEQTTETDILSEYEDLFTGLGCVPGVHHIQIDPEVAPVDILVWGEDTEQHDRWLRQLLDRIRSIKLKLNKNKCKIRMTELRYVGHVLS
ncbi:UNVERIFIED_CONTAM: hypothetical protein FKN15_030303 [Acipenser sinensis]